MLRDLSSNKLRHLANACAQHAHGLTFLPNNGPHGAFEREHLPMSDSAAFVTALVAHAKAEMRGAVSLSYHRDIVVRGNVEPGTLGHLENAFVLELAAAGIHAVRVSVQRGFCGSIGEYLAIQLVGVELTRG